MATDIQPEIESSESNDVAPNSGEVLEFSNPSGKGWKREEPKDKKPRGATSRVSESKAARKKKVERRLGNLYMGLAQGAAALGAEYPAAVLTANSTEFVDAVMEIAEDDPRILDWLDSKAAISGYWKLAFVGVSITLPIAAYYGMAPEFVIPLLGAPAIPEEDEPLLPVEVEQVH